LAKKRPFRRPRFLSQKTAQNAPEKKMLSTAANAIRGSAKVQFALCQQIALHHAAQAKELAVLLGHYL